jgi:hypothetical protein
MLKDLVVCVHGKLAQVTAATGQTRICCAVRATAPTGTLFLVSSIIVLMIVLSIP